MERIKALVELCKEQPFNIDKIQTYLLENELNSEEITRVAIEVCEYGDFSYSDFKFQNNRESQPQELITYNWEKLFDVFIENGLDANLVFCDDGINHENILQSVQYFDDGDLGARVLRNILTKGGNPNILIDNYPFFAEVDSDFIMDIQMGLYPEKWQVDNAFRFWLVLMGFGGVIKDGKCPVHLCPGYIIDAFKEFEKFDYKILYKNNDFELQIFDIETGNIIATV
ncbi:MAG: hypothetical protein IJO92_03505 [Clostridia bacterium]|nr:hypothetical protein [Clostridia bacterium]